MDEAAARTKSPLSTIIGLARAAMPYAVNADLPPSVRRHLPEHAQDIYREAFNHAFAAHAGDPRQEEASHRIAWAAVKRSYVKIGDEWFARTSGG